MNSNDMTHKKFQNIVSVDNYLYYVVNTQSDAYLKGMRKHYRCCKERAYRFVHRPFLPTKRNTVYVDAHALMNIDKV